MNVQRHTAITKDFDAFLGELRAAGLQIDLEPGVAQYVDLSREAAFRAGWACGQHFQEQHDAEAPTVRCAPLSTVRALVGIGDRAWVQPLAIIEHIITGERFVDPRFTIVRQPSDSCCIELVVTSEGLIAVGPNDLHRLTHEIHTDRLRPLLRFEPLAAV
jgi:hypothetical protein